jgi:acylphosphatase
MIARRVTVRGRVHGVFFRESMVRSACAAGVTGWVRNNRRDGTVEAWVQGAPEAVDALVAWCRRGPPEARVEAVEVHDVAPDSALATFTRVASV